MLKDEIRNILSASKKWGWVMEPDAKHVFSIAGLYVPRFAVVNNPNEAAVFADDIGYPVVAKVVSPEVIHKSEVKGVVVGIETRDQLEQAFAGLQQIKGFSGMLVEEMLVGGIELIIGGTMDYQFGPMVLLGIGGVGVEIYRDTSLRMAPIDMNDALAMINGLKAHRLLEGYRGTSPIAMDELCKTLMIFSELLTDLDGLIETIDLNPVICTSHRCIIADARIILAKKG
ncbi:MAG TPA: acetyl-CoA synthetase [Deltaproteobacteria bacterium]|nr:acetyl-CoA synthetase [Deltaproteobacteria bacterium]